MNYREVRALFNGQPSNGHAYDLMRQAGEATGFNYEERDGDKNNRLTVNRDAVNSEAAFHAANKDIASEVP